MQLLHVSDIHFKGKAAGTETDPEKMYQEHILHDVALRTGILGKVDGILVTGDIAFAGKKHEYEAASNWLDSLAAACGCSPSNVYVVPGNHDVDRSVVAKNAAVSNAIEAVWSKAGSDRENALRRQLEDPETSAAILRPIAAYNEFARAYQCQVTSPRLSWENPVRIDGETVLNIRGLHSALLCGWKPNEEQNQLYLGPVQSGTVPSYGTINLVLAHHPPEWMADRFELEDRLLAGPNIALFGHEHRPSVSQGESDCILIRAGSANPDRRENGWQPAYGWIHISMEGTEPDRKAKIRVRQFAWQRSPAGFVAKKYRNGNTESDFKDYLLPVSGTNLVESDSEQEQADLVRSRTSNNDASKITMSDSPTQRPDIRSMLFQIWRLDYADRKEILSNLGLGQDIPTENEDAWVDTCFREAIAKDLLAELGAAIAKKDRV